VSRAHEQGFKVIIDWVANHTGWDHVWTKEHPEYYKMDPVTKDFAMASGMDDIIELDFNKPELRKAMINAMKFWINETGIDGFRCDLAFWVELPFWIEAKAELEKDKRLFWLGELDPLEHPEYMRVFDAAYTWTWMHKTEEFYKNKLSVKTLDTVLERYQHTNGMKAWFTTNHDENSWNGTEYEKYGDAAKAFAVFSCTWPGVPLIYSGQELPNRKRLKFFEKDVIDWKDDYQLHSFYQTLLKLHSDNPALNGDHTIASVSRLNTSADDKVIAFRRKNENHEVVVLLNLSDETIHLEIKNQRIEGKFTEVFSKLENNFLVNRNFKMSPWSYLVFEK
jgi:glycosidase